MFRRALVSSDRLPLATYHYGTRGKQGIIFSHATGLHGRVFDPVAKELGDEYNCISLDHRGHGNSFDFAENTLNWKQFGDDITEIVNLNFDTSPCLGVGHSMGATALLFSALENPGLFNGLVLYEPIIYPPELARNYNFEADSILARGARRRKSSFSSYDQALTNFSEKMPMKLFHSSTLELYIKHGFYNDDQCKKNEGITCDEMASLRLHIKCSPSVEAEVYNKAHTAFCLWDSLSTLRLSRPISFPSVYILSGFVENSQPSSWAKRIADLIPNSTYIKWENNSHFGPCEDPLKLANTIRTVSCQR